MLGKLMKYDLRDAMRKMSLLWGAYLVLTLINMVLSYMGFSAIPEGIIGSPFYAVGFGVNMIWVVSTFAVMLVTVLYIIKRFYAGMFLNEGYIVHTLPVKSWQLLMSKVLTALLVILISMTVILLSLMLLAGPGRMGSFMRDMFFSSCAFPFFAELFGETGTAVSTAVLYMIVCCLGGILFAVSTLYLSISVGHLFSTHRVAWSVGAFIVIGRLLLPQILRAVNYGTYVMAAGITDCRVHLQLYSTLAFDGFVLVLIVVMFCITRYILGHKVNID